MAYTYLIGWSKYNKWYYGVRFAKNCHPDDLWTKYFTSSKHVKQFREQYGEPDIIEIRKVFKSEQEARIWEEKVLKRMNVINEDKWINKTNNKSIDPICALKGSLSRVGKKHSNETKLKMCGPKSEQHKLNMRIARKKLFENGYKTPNPALREDVKNKMSKIKKIAMKGSGNNMYGKKIYNNGFMNRAFKETEVPTGWIKGRFK